MSAESDLKDAGSMIGNTDMTLYNVIEKLLKTNKSLAFRVERENGYTPLHMAFGSGNLEAALWIMAVLQNNYGPDTLNELINTRDNVRNIYVISTKVVVNSSALHWCRMG